ncbi:MAG: copper amine oxidase N-terminal domain-containing protein [Thermovenabulum sp.]|uniref:copper amine oxidase N-terminal domain-containing protein n=1 Tax=Thermovenabulum sp. TaxID=3100335 RepID=UPI003C7E9CEE
MTKKQARIITALIIFTFLITFVLIPIVKAEEREIKVVIDGNEVTFPDQKPIIDENNRVLVPIRTIAEKFYCYVEWDQVERKVTIKQGIEKEITLWIGKKTAIINRQKRELDTSPATINGRTMLPLRFISENFNSKVEWDGGTYTVKITRPQPSPYVDYTNISIENRIAKLFIKLKDELPNDLVKIMQNKRNWLIQCNINEHPTYNLDIYDNINIDLNLQNKEITISNIKLPKTQKFRQVVNYIALLPNEDNGTSRGGFAKFEPIFIEADPNTKMIEIESIEFEKGQKPNSLNIIIKLTDDPGFYVTASNIEMKRFIDRVLDKNFDPSDHFTDWIKEEKELIILNVIQPEPKDIPQEVKYEAKYNQGDKIVSNTYIVPAR